MLNKYSTIFWDFDGVILNSDNIRTEGFKYIFDSYSKKEIDMLINYHKINGGLSRYEKIEFFSQKILDEKLNDEQKRQYAQLYSNYCKERLCDKNLLIKSSINFIKENHKNFDFHLVSASDEKELIYISSNLDIKKYFKSISGSPVNKIENIKKLLKSNNYNESRCCLIGDSINDKFAATENKISFFGFNNKLLINDSEYIHTFESLL